MSATKVAVSIDQALLERVDSLVRTHTFRSHDEMIQEAISEKVSRMDSSALAEECAKLDPKSEQAMADEGLAADLATWPKY
jgi:metal-responsive CopG/Arc/MetJ family transcriptional regulator